MNIIKLAILIISGFISLSPGVYAEEAEQGSKWFVGGGVSNTFFVEDGSAFSLSSNDTFSESGFDFHFGKEFFGNSKLMLGYQQFENSSSEFFTCFEFTGECEDATASDKLNSIYLKFRPHWEISESFLLYGELGIHNYSRSVKRSDLIFTDMSLTTVIEDQSFRVDENDSKIGLSWGVGAVYRFGNHDISLGYSVYSLGGLVSEYDAVSAISLQYDYRFDI